MQRLLLSISIMLISIFPALYSSEECMLYPVSLAERCNQSEIIAEGKVIDKVCFRNPSGTMIYTAYRLHPTKIFKGKVSDDIEFITEGGILGNEAVTVSPGISLQIPMSGIFFLQKAKSKRSNFDPKKQYAIFSGVQGIITYITDGFYARDPFTQYRDIKALHVLIEKNTGKAAEILEPLTIHSSKLYDKSEKTLAASISSISPTTANAGKDEVLTINGSGFGASYTGTANVQFKSADDGGTSWVSVLASHIVSWSNTQIQVKVRTGAGTGQVRVTAVDGTQATSTQTLTITYNLLNITTGSNNQYKTWLQNQDGSGGITFTFNTAFSTNTDAVNAFKRALQTWRCNTYVNFKLSESTSSIESESGGDGINIIAFNDANLPAGALGVTYNYWSSCSAGIWYVNALDMIFRSSPSPAGWNFGPHATTGNRFDFESVCVHELGHAHQLGHVIDNSIIMHYAIGTNTDKRNLNAASDIGGGNDVVAYSTSSKPCGPTIMTALNSSNCQVGLPPVANFAGTPISGCAPLAVAFTDQSTNTPTSWAWDIDNNGSTDYTTQNINHTFTNSGTYSVKLTATNGNGTNAFTRTNYITVHALPTARSGGLKRPCFGQQISLAATPAATGGTTPYSYSWNPTTGLSNATVANPTLVCNFTETRIYVLTVTDLNGCISSSRDTIMPNPRTTVNAGSDKAACRLENIQLGGSPTASNGTPPYTYSWSPTAGLNNPASANPSLTVIQSGTYIVTVTDAGNCSNRDTVIITLRPQPIASCGADKQICAGGNVIVGGSPSASTGTPPYTYSWSPIAGLNNATISNPLANPSQTTQYVLTVTDANNCSDTDTLLVTVNALPQPVITNSGSLNVCEGDSVILSTGDFTTYSWSNGMNTKSIKVSSGGQYTVTVTNANNCTATSSPVTVTVLPKPKPVISPLRPISFCEGDSTILDAGAGYTTYLWSNGASARTITAKQTGSYYVTVTNAENCSAQSEIVAVTSKPYPNKTITGPNSLCENSKATYSVTASDQTSNTWQVINGDILSGEGTNSITVQWKQQSGSVSNIRERLGCTSVGSYSVTISSTLKPVITLTKGLPCSGDSVTLSAPDGYTTYEWSNGANTQSIFVLQNGSFTVKVTDENECKGTSDEFVVNFTEKPMKPTIERREDTLFSSPAHSYQWFRDNNQIAGATESRFTLKQSGNYTVLVKDALSCSNISETFTVGILDIPENENNSLIKIMPVPAEETIYIQHPFTGDINFSVYDALGNIIITTPNNISSIDISKLSHGVYMLMIKNGNKHYSAYFIKE